MRYASGRSCCVLMAVRRPAVGSACRLHASMHVGTPRGVRCPAGVAEREAGIVPGAVSYALQQEVAAPIEQWLWAYQVAQVGGRWV